MVCTRALATTDFLIRKTHLNYNLEATEPSVAYGHYKAIPFIIEPSSGRRNGCKLWSKMNSSSRFNVVLNNRRASLSPPAPLAIPSVSVSSTHQSITHAGNSDSSNTWFRPGLNVNSVLPQLSASSNSRSREPLNLKGNRKGLRSTKSVGGAKLESFLNNLLATYNALQVSYLARLDVPVQKEELPRRE